MSANLPHDEILRQLAIAGYGTDFTAYVKHREGWVGTLSVAGVAALDREPEWPEQVRRFCRGSAALHQDIGPHLFCVRSFKGRFGPGSLQGVVSRKTRRAYFDVDRDNPDQDLAGAFAHFFLAMVPEELEKLFGHGGENEDAVSQAG